MFEDFGRGGGRLRQLEGRIARLERMLMALIDHLDVPYDDSQVVEKRVSDRVLHLAQSGRTIDAIKQYRHETGVGLAEAKDVVDRLRSS